MALDPLEKEMLRRKMAVRMGVFLEGAKSVTCISGHTYWEPHLCELCQQTHSDEIVVVKNRSNKKWSVAISCLKEMIRFQVTDVEDLSPWLEKLKVLRVDMAKRKEESDLQRQEERKKLEKKVIVRKRSESSAAT